MFLNNCLLCFHSTCFLTYRTGCLETKTESFWGIRICHATLSKHKKYIEHQTFLELNLS